MANHLKIAVFTMGLSGLIAQMVLLRELLIIFSGNELSIGIIFANWLILEALGCYISAKRAEFVKNKIETFAVITIFFSVSLPLMVYLTRILKNILGISIGENLSFLPMLYSSFLILLPVSVSHGALFPFLCKIYSLFSDRDTSVGKVYAYETIGMIFGGIIWTYLLIPHFNSFQIAVALAVINFFVLLILFVPYKMQGILTKATIIICALFFILSSYMLVAKVADKLHHLSITYQWKGHNIVHYQNSIYGNICVIEREGQYIFFSDGVANLIIPIPDIAFVEEFVHLPLLIHPYPEKVLIVSSGAGGVIDAVLKHPSIEMVDYTELDPLLIKLIRKFSTAHVESELTDKRVVVNHIDGHIYMKMTANEYDLIFIGLFNPSDLQINRFFTKEFFSLAKRKLSSNGILVIGLPGSLTYINDELINLNSCILNTLKGVFTHVKVFPGDDTNLYLASDSEEVSLIDTSGIIKRLSERELKTEMILPWYIERKLHPGWEDWFSRFLERGTKKINSDLTPIGLFYSISHWNSLYAPHLTGIFKWLEKINIWIFCIALVFFAFISIILRRRINTLSFGIPLCIATTGFAGMLFDLGVIFIFQTIYGYVFFWVGLLVTAFMAGSTSGALITTSFLNRIKDCMKSFIIVDLTIIVFSLALPFIYLSIRPYADNLEIFPFLKILFLLISFISGFLIGAQFPLANKLYMSQTLNLSKSAGLLYSLDLLGGWLGGLIGSLVLFPILGILEGFIVVVLLKLWSFFVLILNPSPFSKS